MKAVGSLWKIGTTHHTDYGKTIEITSIGAEGANYRIIDEEPSKAHARGFQWNSIFDNDLIPAESPKPIGSEWIHHNPNVSNAGKRIHITEFNYEQHWYTWIEPGTKNRGGFMIDSPFDKALIPFDQNELEPVKKINMEGLL